MDINEIKRLAQENTVEQLEKAEGAMYEEQTPEITVNGKDEGEMLTHILGAIFVIKHMEETGEPLPKAVRAYTGKVRKSIS
ncbi:MAG: DUF6952 family protein [Luteibaculaceae bacterium]